MQSIYYFFIKPNQSLLDESVKWDAWEKEFAEETQCWEHKGSRSQDIFIKAKIAFLIDAITEHGSERLVALLGDKPISVSTFDKWWSIEGHELYGNLDESDENCLDGKMVEYTGSEYVDSWLKTRVKNA